MSTSLVKPKKLKLTDYEVFQTLGTGVFYVYHYIRILR